MSARLLARIAAGGGMSNPGSSGPGTASVLSTKDATGAPDQFNGTTFTWHAATVGAPAPAPAATTTGGGHGSGY